MPEKSSLIRHPGPGCIVEFLMGNQTQLAWVLEESSGKLKLYTINKRETNLPANRLLPWSGPQYPSGANRSEIEQKLAAHQAHRQDILAKLDIMELWELSQGEMREASAEWLASLSFSEASPDEVAAVGRGLLGCKTHFKFHPPLFEILPAELVERRLAEAAAAEERERLVNAGRDFLHKLWSVWASGRKAGGGAHVSQEPDPQTAEKLKELLRALIADPEASEPAALWNILRKGLPEHPHQPLILAEVWGIVAAHHNYLLDSAAYEQGDAWSARFAGEISEISRQTQALAQAPEDTPFVSIDSSTTRDIDDAFHLSREADGNLKLSLALACPALGWNFESPLGRAVGSRATSLYLPEAVTHMLPESLALGLFSLKQGQTRPALVLDWLFSPDFCELSFSPRLAWITVAENMSYSKVEGQLEDNTASPSLSLASQLSKALRERRLKDGAVIIERPEPKIHLQGYPDDVKVDISIAEPRPLAQLMVSELMILANQSLAVYALAQGLPLLHRTQDMAIPPEIKGVWSKPEDIHAAVKHMAPAVLELAAKPHASLAAKAYSPITSPLRRLPDLINLAQVLSFLATGSPRFTRDELSAQLPQINSRLEAVSQIQRFRPRYWKLLYLKQNCREQLFPAVVVEEGPAFATLALPEVQIYVRASKDTLGGKAFIGQHFNLRLGKIDPLTNDLRVLEAEE